MFSHRRGAEGVDRLRVVADDGEACAARAQPRAGSRACSTLVSWYSSTSTWSKQAADLGGERGVLHHRAPVEQQVVVVERLDGELLLRIGAEQAGERLLPFARTREGASAACRRGGPACSSGASRWRGRCPCAGSASRSSTGRARGARRRSGRPRRRGRGRVKLGSRPTRRAFCRMRRLAIAWKVPDHGQPHAASPPRRRCAARGASSPAPRGARR